METLAIAMATIGAGAFRGVTGFGYAMVASLGISEALMLPAISVPFILLNDLLLTAFTLTDRKHGSVDWAAGRILLVSGLCGAVCGGLLAAHLDGNTARMMVAIVVALAACVAMIRNPPHWLASQPFGILFGFAVGLLLSAFAVGGPLAAAWLLAGGTQKQHVRGTLAVFFGVIDIASLVSRFFIGTIDWQLVQLLAFYFPLTLAGFGVGFFLSRRRSPNLWHRLSSGGLVLIAAIGLVQAIGAFLAA
ncbi:putative membrane protein YfcA [Neorhizobium galegae]|uniref:sulfite exporter TauE/SafE family protein n=1 Tax=Neorhizobium galegae TaxID=399 RepID=UPI001AE6A491|nr:sulfite exporter TauE/SafE family protein [Neorhizobium galegae]MBP2563280.1 putative membrane protein YfcA [Neorhizobium galegae]